MQQRPKDEMDHILSRGSSRDISIRNIINPPKKECACTDAALATSRLRNRLFSSIPLVVMVPKKGNPSLAKWDELIIALSILFRNDITSDGTSPFNVFCLFCYLTTKVCSSNFVFRLSFSRLTVLLQRNFFFFFLGGGRFTSVTGRFIKFSRKVRLLSERRRLNHLSSIHLLTTATVI